MVDTVQLKELRRTILLSFFFSTSVALATQATFITALPVATDQLLVRFNALPSFATSGFHGVQFPVSVAYGLTSRWALFVNTNQGFGSMSNASPQGPTRLNSGGSGDTGLFSRYTLYRIDKPKSTFRVAALAGAFLPTGANALMGQQGLLPKALQTGAGTIDPYVGVTMSYSAIRWGAAVDSTYRVNRLSNAGISPGSQYRSDGQIEYTILPVHEPEEGLPKLLLVSFEWNYLHDAQDHVNGVLNRNSGGNVLRHDILLERSTLRWQIGVGVQAPLLQDLPGSHRMKQRFGLLLYYEYYLAAPNWRKRHS